MPDCYEFDGFLLDVPQARVTRGGEPVKLTAKSFSVLALLVERAPNVVSRAEFEASVWPEGFVDPGNLTQTIYMVRKALGERDAPIETVNGRGYRLSTAVRALQANAMQSSTFSEAHELIDADRVERGRSAATQDDVANQALSLESNALVNANSSSSANRKSDSSRQNLEQPSAVRRAIASFQHAIGRGRRTTVALFAIASAAGTVYAISFAAHPAHVSRFASADDHDSGTTATMSTTRR